MGMKENFEANTQEIVEAKRILLEKFSDKEGLYVWERYKVYGVSVTETSYSPVTFQLTAEAGDLTTASMSDFDGWVFTRSNGAYITLSGDGTCTSTSASGVVENHTWTYTASTQTITTTKSYTVGYAWTCEPVLNIDYVVADAETSYPNGGELDGYWYEIYPKVQTKTVTPVPEGMTITPDVGYLLEKVVLNGFEKGAEYGIFAEKLTSGGWFEEVKIVMEDVPEYMFSTTNASYSLNIFNQISKLEINANNIKDYAFYQALHNKETDAKIKVKVNSLGHACFAETGAKNAKACNFWISKDCQTINATSFVYAPFINSYSGARLYCEAKSKPSGWANYWNYVNSANALSTTWGVTEEQFDAL